MSSTVAVIVLSVDVMPSCGSSKLPFMLVSDQGSSCPALYPAYRQPSTRSTLSRPTCLLAP